MLCITRYKKSATISYCNDGLYEHTHWRYHRYNHHVEQILIKEKDQGGKNGLSLSQKQKIIIQNRYLFF